MQRISRIAMWLLACSLLAAFPAFAAIPKTLPPAQTQGAVTYVSGGIGQKEAQAFEAAARQYPLDLEFASTHTACKVYGRCPRHHHEHPRHARAGHAE
jgi:hypothetical protein